jgi:hypothetical protein
MQRIFAGGVVFFALVLIADIPQTASIAVAFAYLILLSAALTVGPVAFGRVSALVGGAPASNSGSGSHAGAQLA